MNDSIVINGYSVMVNFDPETGTFRGEFTGLNGGADFYSESLEGLREEGAKSLEAFLAVCRERGIKPEVSAVD